MKELICFCFNYAASDIKKDIQVNSESTILKRILTEKKAGGCHCAIKNPKSR